MCLCVCFQRTVHRDRRDKRIAGRRRVLPGPVHRVRGQVSEKAVRLLLTRLRLPPRGRIADFVHGSCTRAYCTTRRQIHDELDEYSFFFLRSICQHEMVFISYIIVTSLPSVICLLLIFFFFADDVQLYKFDVKIKLHGRSSHQSLRLCAVRGRSLKTKIQKLNLNKLQVYAQII